MAFWKNWSPLGKWFSGIIAGIIGAVAGGLILNSISPFPKEGVCELREVSRKYQLAYENRDDLAKQNELTNISNIFADIERDSSVDSQVKNAVENLISAARCYVPLKDGDKYNPDCDIIVKGNMVYKIAECSKSIGRFFSRLASIF